MDGGLPGKRSVPVLSRAAAVLAALSFLAPALAPAAEDEKPKKGKKPALLHRQAEGRGRRGGALLP
jgi:hypothetical protein